MKRTFTRRRRRALVAQMLDERLRTAVRSQSLRIA
jgi:hypothetical protein